MVPRPKGVEAVATRIRFNLRSYDELEIDLHHVNYGRSGNSPCSNNSIEDAKGLIMALLVASVALN